MRDKILEAAYDLFAEYGYEKTTVAQIIELAGASKGGFYHHFESKEDLLEAISLSYIASLKSFYEDILTNTSLSAQDKFKQYFYTLGDMKRDSLKDLPKIRNLYNHSRSHIVLQRFADAFDTATRDFF